MNTLPSPGLACSPPVSSSSGCGLRCHLLASGGRAGGPSLTPDTWLSHRGQVPLCPSLSAHLYDTNCRHAAITQSVKRTRLLKWSRKVATDLTGPLSLTVLLLSSTEGAPAPARRGRCTLGPRGPGTGEPPAVHQLGLPGAQHGPRTGAPPSNQSPADKEPAKTRSRCVSLHSRERNRSWRHHSQEKK